MSNYAVIYTPQFSLQSVLRHEAELWSKPVVLVDPDVPAPVISELTEPARAAGISVGLSPTQAMARCAGVLFRPRSLAQEQAAQSALLQCAYAFSPHLELTAPGICTLDLQHLAALTDADRPAIETWARRIQQTLARMNLSVTLGLAETPNVARHAARWGCGLEIVDAPETFLATLPVVALDPSSQVAVVLQRWGIRTVGELLALGQEALSERLGLEALALYAAAASRNVRPLNLVCPAEQFDETFEFNPEVETVEPLLFLLRRFIDQLVQRLEPRGFAAAELLLKLTLESGQTQSSRLRVPQPTRQPEVLFRTLHSYLESLRTDSAIRVVSLTVVPTRDQEKQLGLFETVLADPHQFQETLARLSAVLGPDRVGTPTLENSHRPDAFHLNAPDFENAPLPLEKEAPFQALLLRRFRPSIPADVECEPENSARDAQTDGRITGQAERRPGKRPISVRCSLVQGKLNLVVGPWRASGHWWDPETTWEREEWDAATSDGPVIRLVHQPDGWFVEGVVD